MLKTKPKKWTLMAIAIIFAAMAFSAIAFAATYGDGQSLPGEINSDSEITGHIKQNSTAKLAKETTLTIKDGGVLELAADTACINFLLEKGGKLIIENGGKLILNYTSDTVVHNEGTIYNYGDIINKGSLTLDGATVYNYGNFDNQLWLNLNSGAKIYSTVPINGVNNIEPLDPESGVEPPITPALTKNDGDATGSGIVINVDTSSGDVTGSGIGGGEETIDDGTQEGDPDKSTKTDESSQTDDSSASDGGDQADEFNTSGAVSQTDEASSDSGSQTDDPENNDPEKSDTGTQADASEVNISSEIIVPIKVINNIPDEVTITAISTSDKDIIDVAIVKGQTPVQKLVDLFLTILGKKEGESHSRTFYVAPVENLKKGTHRTNLLLRYKAPTATGQTNDTLAIPITVNVGKGAELSYEKDTGVIGEWALVNLLIAILILLATFVFIVGAIIKRANGMRDIMTRSRGGFVAKFLTVPIAAAAVIVFLLTENIKLNMVYIDEWTGWMAALLVLELATMALTKGSGGASKRRI